MLQRFIAYLQSAGSPEWAVRRRLFVATWIFCVVLMSVTIALLVFKLVTETFATLIVGQGFLMIGSLVTIYSKYANADDADRRRAGVESTGAE